MRAQFWDQGVMYFRVLDIAATKPREVTNSDEDHGRQFKALGFYVRVKEDFVTKALKEEVSKVPIAEHQRLKPMLKDLGSFLLANQAALYALDNFISPNNGCSQNGAAENKP